MEIATKIEEEETTTSPQQQPSTSPTSSDSSSSSSSSSNNNNSQIVNNEILNSVKNLLNQLPPENELLLQHLLCLLWHISFRSSENKMCSMNLAVCIGPSLLSYIPNTCAVDAVTSASASVKSKGHSRSLITLPVTIGKGNSKNSHVEVMANAIDLTSICREEVSKSVPKIISFLIDHCIELYDESIIHLLGPELLSEIRPDSAIEVTSDSLNSLNSVIDASSNSILHRETPPSASSPSASASTCDSGTNAGCTTSSSSSSSTSGDSTGGHSGSDYFSSSNNSHTGHTTATVNGGGGDGSTTTSSVNLTTGQSNCNNRKHESSVTKCVDSSELTDTSATSTTATVNGESCINLSNELKGNNGNNSKKCTTSTSSSSSNCNSSNNNGNNSNNSNNSANSCGNASSNRDNVNVNKLLLRSTILGQRNKSSNSIDRKSMPSMAPFGGRIGSVESLSVHTNHGNHHNHHNIVHGSSCNNKACSSFDISTSTIDGQVTSTGNNNNNSTTSNGGYYVTNNSPSNHLHLEYNVQHQQASHSNLYPSGGNIYNRRHLAMVDSSTTSLLPDELHYYTDHSLYYDYLGSRNHYTSQMALLDHFYSPYRGDHHLQSTSLPYYPTQAASMMALDCIPYSSSPSDHHRQSIHHHHHHHPQFIPEHQLSSPVCTHILSPASITSPSGANTSSQFMTPNLVTKSSSRLHMPSSVPANSGHHRGNEMNYTSPGANSASGGYNCQGLSSSNSYSGNRLHQQQQQQQQQQQSQSQHHQQQMLPSMPHPSLMSLHSSPYADALYIESTYNNGSNGHHNSLRRLQQQSQVGEQQQVKRSDQKHQQQLGCNLYNLQPANGNGNGYSCSKIEHHSHLTRVNSAGTSTPVTSKVSPNEQRPFLTRLIPTHRPQRQLQYGLTKKIALQSANLRSLDSHHLIHSMYTSNAATSTGNCSSSGNLSSSMLILNSTGEEDEDEDETLATPASGKVKSKSKSKFSLTSGVTSKSTSRLSALSNFLTFGFAKSHNWHSKNSSSSPSAASSSSSSSGGKGGSKVRSKERALMYQSHPSLISVARDELTHSQIHGQGNMPFKASLAFHSNSGHQLVPSNAVTSGNSRGKTSTSTSALPLGASSNLTSPLATGTGHLMTRATTSSATTAATKTMPCGLPSSTASSTVTKTPVDMQTRVASVAIAKNVTGVGRATPGPHVSSLTSNSLGKVKSISQDLATGNTTTTATTCANGGNNTRVSSHQLSPPSYQETMSRKELMMSRLRSNLVSMKNPSNMTLSSISSSNSSLAPKCSSSSTASASSSSTSTASPSATTGASANVNLNSNLNCTNASTAAVATTATVASGSSSSVTSSTGTSMANLCNSSNNNNSSTSVTTTSEVEMVPDAIYKASLDAYKADLVSGSNVTLRAIPVRISSRSEGEDDDDDEGEVDEVDHHHKSIDDECKMNNQVTTVNCDQMMTSNVDTAGRREDEEDDDENGKERYLTNASKASSISSILGDESNSSSIYISELDSNCSASGGDSIRSSPALSDDTCCSSSASSSASASISHRQVSTNNNNNHKVSSHHCHRHHQSTGNNTTCASTTVTNSGNTGRGNGEDEDDDHLKRCTECSDVTSSHSSITSGVRSDSSNSSSSSIKSGGTCDEKLKSPFNDSSCNNNKILKLIKKNINEKSEQENNSLNNTSSANLNSSKSQHAALVESCFRCSSHNLLWHECFHEKL